MHGREPSAGLEKVQFHHRVYSNDRGFQLHIRFRLEGVVAKGAATEADDAEPDEQPDPGNPKQLDADHNGPSSRQTAEASSVSLHPAETSTLLPNTPEAVGARFLCQATEHPQQVQQGGQAVLRRPQVPGEQADGCRAQEGAVNCQESQILSQKVELQSRWRHSKIFQVHDELHPRRSRH